MVVNTQCVIVIPTLPQYTLQKEHVANHQSQEKTANRIKIKADQDGSRWIKTVQEGSPGSAHGSAVGTRMVVSIIPHSIGYGTKYTTRYTTRHWVHC